MSFIEGFGISIPKVSGPTSDRLVSYGTAPAGQLINEAWESAKGTFGGTGPFTRLNEAAPAFDQLSAMAQLKEIEYTDPYYNTAASVYNATESSATASAINEELGTGAQNSQNHKVRLVAPPGAGAASELVSDPAYPFEPLNSDVVEFDIMPEVGEQRTMQYEALSTPQLPGQFQKYGGTQATVWTITGLFTCRTRAEAKRNLTYINVLRGWSQAFFGENQAQQFPGKLGAPPPVLTFSGWRRLIGPVPVVLTMAQWQWPRDCDWIPTGIRAESGEEIPFPTVMQVNLNLVESFSPEQFNGFDLVQFRRGLMTEAYKPLARGTNYSNTGQSAIPITAQGSASPVGAGRGSYAGFDISQATQYYGQLQTQAQNSVQNARAAITKVLEDPPLIPTGF